MSLNDCLQNKPFEISIENKNVNTFLQVLEDAKKQHDFNIEIKQNANYLYFVITATGQNFASAYYDLKLLFHEFIKNVKS